MSVIKIVLEGLPPTLNHTYGLRGGSKPFLYKKKEAKDYQEMVGWAAKQHAHLLEPCDQYGVILFAFLSDRRRDVDAHQKLLLDGIAAGLGVNDRCFRPILVDKFIVKGIEPFIVVWIASPGEAIQLFHSFYDQAGNIWPDKRDTGWKTAIPANQPNHTYLLDRPADRSPHSESHPPPDAAEAATICAATPLS